MRTAIIFYSRTGTTRRVADALAAELDADIGEIHCHRFRPGPLRYLMAGYHSVKGNLPTIEGPDMDFSSHDLVVIGTPVWTSHPSLPVRAFLAGKPDLPDRVALFLTHGGHSPAETAISEFAALLPHPLAGSLAIDHDTALKADISERVRTFAATLIANQAG